MRPSGLLLLLLAACSTARRYDDYIWGAAFLHNPGSETVDLRVDVLDGVDCLFVEQPALGRYLTARNPTLVSIAPGETQAPWNNALLEDDREAQCRGLRAQLGEETATLVVDLYNEREIEVPAPLSRLPGTTLLVDTSAQPVLTDGSAELVSEFLPAPPACTTEVPSWSGPAAVSAVLRELRVEGACQSLVFDGLDPVQLCNGPAFSYLAGQEIVVSHTPSSFESRTVDGAKTVRLGTDVSSLPADVDLYGRHPDGMDLEPDVPGSADPVSGLLRPTCATEHSCGPALAIQPILDAGFLLERLEWNAPLTLRLADRIRYDLTIYHASQPLRLDCPLQVHWSLVAESPVD